MLAVKVGVEEACKGGERAVVYRSQRLQQLMERADHCLLADRYSMQRLKFS